jgi:hypothetical protein
MRAQEQMVWIYASSIVTPMANIYSSGDFAAINLISDPVGYAYFTLVTDASVPVFVMSPIPKPTPAIWLRRNFLHEPNFDRLSFKNTLWH